MGLADQCASYEQLDHGFAVQNKTPLHMAAQTSNIEAVELLLAAEADVNATDSEVTVSQQC